MALNDEEKSLEMNRFYWTSHAIERKRVIKSQSAFNAYYRTTRRAFEREYIAK